MDCLKDYIGLTGCGVQNPASGLFINSLPGISLKAIDSLADADQVNYVGVWNDIQIRAIKRLELNVISEMAKNTALKGSKFQTSTHAFPDDTASAYDGIAAQFKSNCDSAFQFHYFGSFTLDTPWTADTFTVVFTDMDTTEVLATYTLDLLTNAQEPFTFPINAKFYRKNIQVTITGVNGTYHSSPIDNIYHCAGSIQWGYIDKDEFIGGLDSHGLNLNGYSIGCDANNIACDNKSLFATTLWYLLGSEMMMERIASNRVNFWTMDRKQAEELKAYFDVEAEKNLKMAMNGISFADCDCCTKCDPVIAIREAHL